MPRDLSVEITRLIAEIHPTAVTGDMPAVAIATAQVADVLGGMFALIRKHAPNEATAQAAMRLMIERSLRFAGDAQKDADSLRAQVSCVPGSAAIVKPERRGCRE